MEKTSLPLSYYLNNGEPDKTGYQQLALSAFYKAVNFHPEECVVTLGPNAGTLERKKSRSELVNASTQTPPKNGHRGLSLDNNRLSFDNKEINEQGSLIKSVASDKPSSVKDSQDQTTEDDEDEDLIHYESPEEKEEKLIRKRILNSLENMCLSESQVKINSMRRQWAKRNEESLLRLQNELDASKYMLEARIIDDLKKKQVVIEEVPTDSSTTIEDKLKWETPIITKPEPVPTPATILNADEVTVQTQQILNVNKERPNVQVLPETNPVPLVASQSIKVEEPPTLQEFEGSPVLNEPAFESQKNIRTQFPTTGDFKEKNKETEKTNKEEKKNAKNQEIIQPKPEITQNTVPIEEEKKLSMDEDIIEDGKKETQETKTIDPETERILSVMAHYKKYWKIYSEVVSSLKDFLSNDALKKFRTECQKAVNVPVNAISGVSAAHLSDKLHKLTALLSGATVLVNNKSFNPSQHPLGVTYCTYLLAEKIVKQGEDAVSVKSDSAFPIALVTLEIWKKFPNFGELLLGAFHKKCPYLIPMYWIKEDGMTNEEYYRKLGFKYDGDERENIDMFLKRQGGIVRLYFSIVISQLRNPADRSCHPLPLNEAWRWLAMFTALEPSAEITATLLYDMLDITGNSLLKTYGKQFLKLIYLICVHFVPKIEKVTPEGKGGPVARLKSFLEKLIRTQAVNPPKGILPSNFW